MSKSKIRAEIIEKLKKLGEQLEKDIQKNKDPEITMPIRTLSNAYFDDKDKLIRLGDKKQTRNFFNVGQARKFMQTTLIAAQIKELLEQDKPSISTRQLYYILKRTIEGLKENTFEDQTESDPIIEDVEVSIDALREELGLEPTPKGVFSGLITYKDLRTGDEINCRKMGTAGAAIPANVEPSVMEFKKSEAKFVLVVEKFAVWNVLNQMRFWEKHKCILLTGKGQGERSARRLVSRLNKELKLPVYVFCDFDPYGYYIYSVYKQGSINLAFFSEKSGCPDAKYIGLKHDDIKEFKIPKTNFIKLTDQDLKRLKEIKNYEWFKKKEWQDEIQKAIDFGYKIESDALVSKTIEFMGDTYLPKVIKDKDWLD
ncbi:MAG: DNA topoisomerase [uncultured DHVE6 group euryarchaeote]|jgi:DNA topoisomerase-6 subunit A|nr:MAG: DNA topoisomerase [uncultured DHVE6 group euryarchaeote]